MKNILIGLFSAALLLGGAAAQDAATPAGTPPPEPQTTNPSQPQTSPPADAQTPQPLPESQTPANQSSPQSAPQQPAAQTQTPQTQVPQAGAAAQTGAIKRVAPGSVIPVQLTKGIDAKKAKTGDEVIAKVTQDLRSNSGEVVFAKDTKVVGHVTAAQARDKDNKESQVGIMFDKAVTKTGDLQLPMSIQAVIAPQNPNSADQGGNDATAATAATARPSGMNGSSQAQPPTPPSTGGTSANTESAAAPRPQITGNTQGVVGFSNLNLAAASDATQGSVLTSDKNNVKLDSGTFMLLRVNQ